MYNGRAQQNLTPQEILQSKKILQDIKKLQAEKELEAEKLFKIKAYVTIRGYLRLKYKYNPNTLNIEDMLILRIPTFLANRINKKLLFEDGNINSIKEKEDFFIDEMFPNLSIVKEILEFMDSNPELSRVNLSDANLFELSLELETYQDFINEYKSIPEDELNFKKVLELLEKYGLTEKFGLTL